jgi:hypothetical protein
MALARRSFCASTRLRSSLTHSNKGLLVRIVHMSAGPQGRTRLVAEFRICLLAPEDGTEGRQSMKPVPSVTLRRILRGVLCRSSTQTSVYSDQRATSHQSQLSDKIVNTCFSRTSLVRGILTAHNIATKTPPQVMAEVALLAKICPSDHDVRFDFDGHTWSVYLKPSAALVENPRTEDQRITYLKHMVRSGIIDARRVVKENNGDQKISFERLLTQYSDLNF